VRKDWEGRAADEPASAPRIDDEAGRRVDSPNSAGYALPQAPLDQPIADPEAFLRHARKVIEEFADRMAGAVLTQAGHAAAVVLVSEYSFRFPERSASQVQEDLFQTFNERLLVLAGAAAWAGGRA
jgi:hypothetical protein